MAVSELLGVKSGEQTAQLLLEAKQKAIEAEIQPTSLEDIALSARIETLYTRFRDARVASGVEEAMLESLRRAAAVYSDEKLAAIRDEVGGSEEYFPITQLKCHAAVSWLQDIFTNEAERTWGIKPTPTPNLSPLDQARVMNIVTEKMMQAMAAFEQEQRPVTARDVEMIVRAMELAAREQVANLAERRATTLELRIADIFEEAAWQDVFDDVILDVATLKAGIVKGPFLRNEMRKDWVPDSGTGDYKLAGKRTEVLAFQRVNPFDCYPDPNAVEFERDVIFNTRYSKPDLSALKGVDGYDDAAIDKVLEEGTATTGGIEGSGPTEAAYALQSQIKRLLGSAATPNDAESAIPGKEVWLNISGAEYVTYGFIDYEKADSVDPLGRHDVVVIMVGDTIIYRGDNPDPLGRKPFYKSGWRRIAGSFWYTSLPECMKTIQDVSNATTRSLVNNMAIASGPQVVVNDLNRLVDGEDARTMRPYKVWLSRNPGGSNLKAVETFNIDSRASELMGVLDSMLKYADDHSGVPAYAYGNDQVAGAGRTYSGLAMLMSNAAKGIKKVILNMDRKVIGPLVERIADYLMQNDDDVSLRGDVEVSTEGTVAMLARDQLAERRMRFLEITNNPTDIAIMGMKKRASLLRAAGETIELAGEEVVPSAEEIEDTERRQQLQQQQMVEAQQMEAQTKAQAEQGKLQVSAAKVQSTMQIEQAKLVLKQRELEIKAALASGQLEQGQAKSQELLAKAQTHAAQAGLVETQTGAALTAGMTTDEGEGI